MTATTHSPLLSEAGQAVERHWRELAGRRRLYTIGGIVFMVLAMSGSLWFANESNAGKFFDRLPYLFDFVGQMMPRDGWEIWRALFDRSISPRRSICPNISTRCWKPSTSRWFPR